MSQNKPQNYVPDSYKIFYIFMNYMYPEYSLFLQISLEKFITHFALCFVDRLGLPEITIIIIPFDLKRKSVLKRKY